MSDEIRIPPVRPYPTSNDERRRRRSPEGDEPEPPPTGPRRAPATPDPEPEVKEGHIDTRVAPAGAAPRFL